MKRVKIHVYGRVQGVFFRYFTRKKAESLELNGWCRNENDSSVLIVAEGEGENIEELVVWAHTGSPLAKVEKVEVKEEDYQGKEEGFEVR